MVELETNAGVDETSKVQTRADIQETQLYKYGIGQITEDWPKWIRALPERINEADEKALEGARITQLNEAVKYKSEITTSRSLTGTNLIHGLDVRKVAKELLGHLPKDRQYLRVLDLGCGERFLSLNAVPYFESWAPCADLMHGGFNYDDHFDREHSPSKERIKVVHLNQIPVIEYALDFGEFDNSTRDHSGLFRVDFNNREQLANFTDNVPEGFFDLIVSNCFFGTTDGAFASDYVEPTRENLSIFESRLNKNHGVMMLSTFDGPKDTAISVSEEYGDIRPWPVNYPQGKNVQISRKLDLNNFSWSNRAANEKRLDIVSQELMKDFHLTHSIAWDALKYM